MIEEHVRTMELAKRHDIMKRVLKTVYESAELTSAYAITQAVGTHKKVKRISTHCRCV